jgi:hypothetical protein
MRRLGQFMSSIIIGLWSWNDTITRRQSIIRLLLRADSSSGCLLQMQDRRSVLE